ncbi:MAG: sulfite exporter TauE/SafE family protein [Candidatus Aminicenantes bacterium]|nr:sulfite exporter TauE/SafE family protein [Candidatus Aminicenantes bacterium]
MDFSLTLIESILAFIIATFGSALQGTIGFGLGLIGVPLLVMLNPAYVPGPVLLSALCLTVLIAQRERHAISIKEIKWAVTGRVFGAVIGSYLLTVIPQKNVSVLFGATILLAVIISFSRIKLELNSINLLGAGTVSGLMGTTSAIGGAPMALVYQHQKGPRIRGSLSAIFIFGTIISLTSLIVIHRFGFTEIYAALTLIPGILLGFFLSKRLARILDRGYIRHAVLIASALSGIIVILKNIL